MPPANRARRDLTSAAGKMTMGVIAAVSEFERDLLIERTQAGLRRAKEEGKTLGRRPALSAKQLREIAQLLNMIVATFVSIADHRPREV